MTSKNVTPRRPQTAAVPLNPPNPANPKGYHKLAVLMGSNTDVAIFRSFGTLNMLNLLGLQAELVDLEAQLSDIRQEDDTSDNANRMMYSERFWLLRQSLEEDGDDVQWQMQLSIRKKLVEYNTALSQVIQISGLGKPENSDLEFLRDWLRRPAMGNGFLRGRETRVWDELNHLDLVTLSVQKEGDVFSKWLRSGVLDRFHRILGYRVKRWSTPVDPEAGIVRYEESALLVVANIIGTVLSSLLPILSIIVLYFVKRTLTRLGIMVIFTTLFSATLAIFTSARRVEVFASTAAFAAVEVVFIGSTTTSITA